MTTPTGRPPGRKTYTRLATGRRVPLEYELVSTDLHYNHPMRFELPAANPVVAWYYRYREASALRARDWERFSDPRRTTYRAYTVLQDGREDVIDGLLREIDDTGYDRNLDQEWVRFLDRWYSPLRFPVHGLQMLAAYVAQMAPASRRCPPLPASPTAPRSSRPTSYAASSGSRTAPCSSAARRWRPGQRGS